LKLYIVGSNPPEKIKKLGSEDIEVTGFVRDLSKYYKNCKVMLAPIRFGAGVKGKITQSLTMGLPVVTSSLGAEGINLTDGENGMIADDAEEFANKAVKVYRERELWNTLSTKGVNTSREYSPEKAQAKFSAIFYSMFSSK